MEEKQLHNNRRALIHSILLFLMVAVTGTTFAWFNVRQRLESVSMVQMPATITISGSNRVEMAQFSLNFTSDDIRNGDGTVTLRRVFCIESSGDYLLEVAHTTNIQGLTFAIYPVKAEVDGVKYSEKTSRSAGDVSADDGSTVYYYTPDSTPIEGEYINEKSAGLAYQEGDGGTLHGETYLDEDSNKVQKNAEPLYWQTTRYEDYYLTGYSRYGVDSQGMAIRYRYYVLTITLEESTLETDMVYLLASH